MIVRCFITLCLVLCCGTSACSQRLQNITAPQLQGLLQDSLHSIQLIDVRTAQEYQAGHIPSAVSVDWRDQEAFYKYVQTLDKAQTVYLYCLSGARSQEAADALKKLGFQDIIVMPGGMLEWRKNQFPERSLNNNAIEEWTIDKYNQIINSKGLILVDFYAEWCAPCKKMEPYLNKIHQDSTIPVQVVRINIDQNKNLARMMQIERLPVLYLYKDGQLVWDINELAPEPLIIEKIKQFQ